MERRRRSELRSRLSTVEVSERRAARKGPRRQWYLPFKSFIEWMTALILFVITVPLMAALGAIVRLTSPGPAFYSQARVGRNGRIFLMHKLRSMGHNCEAKTGPTWSAPNDARVTRFGRLLRKTHLDELPQLLNVLQGHMLLIGPRPERPELCALIEQTIPRFRERLLLLPGLTGLAQIQLPADRGLHTVSRKLAYDLYYIREVSPWLDLRIALSTVVYLCGAMFGSISELPRSHYSAADQNDIELIDDDSEMPTS